MDNNTNSIINGDKFWDKFILNGLNPIPSANGYQEIYPHLPQTLYASLLASYQKHSNNFCIIDDAQTKYSYQNLFELVEDFSQVLFYKYRVKPGQHIGLLLYNSIEFCVAFYAINRLNAIVVPLPTKYKKAEILSLVKKAHLNGIIHDERFDYWLGGNDAATGFSISVPAIGSDFSLPTGDKHGRVLLQTASPFDIAVMMFTSGTTSQSKGVLLSNHNVMHAIYTYQKIFNLTDGDRTIIPVPIYHVTGLFALLGLFIAIGGQVYLHKFFDAQRILKDIQNNKITFIHGSPTAFSFLLEKRNLHFHLNSLRILACGSGHLPKTKIRELKEWLPDIEFRTVYGLTETSSPAAIFPGDAAESPYIGSVGHPIPGTQFKICDESGTILPPGHIGTIFIKGTVVTLGYVRATTETLTDGWLDTGDLGYFNEAGYLYVVDRKKDMINRGGEKIFSIDIENLLYSISGIREAAVVGIPDEIYGEVPAAMICLTRNSSLNTEKIQGILRPQLATYQIPVKFLFIDKLPLTENSKIDKKRIRQLLSQNP